MSLQWKSILAGILVAIILVGCGGGNYSSGNYSSGNTTNTISGYVNDDPVGDAEVYIDFGGGNISTKSITKSDGSFEIKLSDADMAQINPKVPKGADAPITDLLIVAKKDGRILRNAISRDINNTGTVYITNDTEAYAEFLKSIGSFNVNALANFNSELQNGRIKNSSKYAKLIKDLREGVKNYFYGGDKLTDKAIFAKALQDLNKSELAKIANDKNILLTRNIVSGGDIILPKDVNVSSDDITITPKGNGRYTLGDGNNPDETVYLKISKSDGTFSLIPVNIKSKTITEVASRSVTPAEGATLGNDNVKVIIPPFALNKTTNITIKKIETQGTSAEGKKILKLEPSGTKFQVPITIKINYADFGVKDPYAVQWKYGSLDEGYDNADIVSVDTANKVIYLNVNHFSDLVVRRIRNQEFLDLGPNFVNLISKRNRLAKLQGSYISSSAPERKAYTFFNDNSDNIITNRLFTGMSTNTRLTGTDIKYVSNTDIQTPNGQCVQFATQFIGAFFNNAVITAFSADKRVKALREKNGSISQTTLINNKYRTKWKDIKKGDYVYIYSKTDRTGHTAVVFDKNDDNISLLESNYWFPDLKKKYGKSKYNRTVGGDAYALRAGVAEHTLLKKHFYTGNTKIKNGEYLILNKDIQGNSIEAKQVQHMFKTVLNNEPIFMSQNGPNILEKPYLYYLVSKIKDGITKIDSSYQYNPDLLPVAPLRVQYNANGTSTIQSTEDAKYEIYVEDLTSQVTFTNVDDGPIVKKYRLNYNGKWQYYTYDEAKKLIDKYRSSKEKSDRVGGYTSIINSQGTKITLGKGLINGHLSGYSTDKIIKHITQTKEKHDKKISTISFVKDSNPLSSNTIDTALKFEGTTLFRLTTPGGVVAQNFISQNHSAYVTSSKLQKILFSPVVIDDYYINWGKDNKNQNIPIGFWNSRGYNLSYTNENQQYYKKGQCGNYNLQADNIYKCEDAVNGYFMTLGNGQSAQWHFALAGPHSIFVNVPTGKLTDIKNAQYILYKNGTKIPLTPAGNVNNTGIKVKNGAFNHWYYLKSNDNNVSFNLTGNDYLEVKAKGGTVVVDAIRLEGQSNRIKKLHKIKGQSSLSQQRDEAFYKCLLKACNTDTGKCIQKIILFGQKFILNVPSNLNKDAHLQFTYVPLPIQNIKSNNQIANMSFRSLTNNINNSAIKYKPVIQDITIKPSETVKNIPPVTLQTYGTKESVKLHLINAVNSAAIKDANVTIRYGINNDNNLSVAYSRTTDENGYFEINNMPYGQYTAVFNKNGFISTSLNMKIDENSNSNYNLSMSPVLAQGEMRIRLSWGANPRDLDSHLVKYVNGVQIYHIYYGDKQGTNGDNLDRDDTDGFGPETITIKKVNANAKYVYFVHKYAGNGEIKNSGASVKISYGNSEQTFYPPQEDGIYWKVFTIENGTIIPCVTGCIQNTTDTFARSFNKNDYSYLFRNLPNK